MKIAQEISTPKLFISFLRSAHGKIIIIALLALIGMAMNSLVVESITFRSADSSEPAVAVDAPYVRVGNTPQEVTMDIYYRGYGNSVLRLTPRYCFLKGYKVNGKSHVFPDKNDSWCQPLMADLRDDLHVGSNILVIETAPRLESPEQYSPNVGLTAGPQLFGKNLIQSLFTSIFLGSVLALLWIFLARQGFDRITRILFVSACGFYFDCLDTIPQYNYSLDMEKHIPYIQYMSEHFFHAHGYTGPEGWHPPLYYMLAALAAKIFQFAGVFDPWTGIRLLSMTSYVIFMYFGLRSIARVLLPGLQLYLATALLVFWPSGLLNAAWVFNDVLIYPLYSICFYYTLVWYDNGESRALVKALISCGIGFAVKTTALVPAVILGICVLFRLFKKQISLRSLFNKEFFVAEIVLIVGVLCNVGGNLYDRLFSSSLPPAYLGGDGDYRTTVDNFFLLDIRDLLTHPFFSRWDDPSMWLVTLKTMLFTNSYWNVTNVGAGLMGLVLLMFVYVLVYIFSLGRKQCIGLLPLIAGTIVPFVALAAFTLITHNSACRDFRYVQPALVAIILMFMLAVEGAKRKDCLLLYYAGNAIAVLFPVLSIILYYMQMHP